MELKSIAILFLSLSCSGILCLVYYSMSFLKTTGSRPFVWFMSSVFVYSLGYMLELSGNTYSGIFFAIKVEYLSVPFVSVFWFLFALEYNGYRIKNRLLYASLFVIPVITVVLLYANEVSHLVYREFVVDSSGPFPVASIVKGTWYYVDFVFDTVLGLAGIVLFYGMTTKTQGYRKKQANTIFYASFIPWAGHIQNALLGRPAGIDMAPFYLSLSVPIFAFAMFRLRMFDIAPIARTEVFETMNNAVIVLDKDFHIADFNHYASKLFPELTADMINLHAREVLAGHKEFIEKVSLVGDGPLEIEHVIEEGVRHFSVSVTKLFSPRKRYLGVIILLYDITEDKLLMNKLHKMATVDALTQVYSRRFFMESFMQELRWMSRKGGNISLLLIDIDHFKNVNDTYGHNAGDLVLKRVAEGFRSILRKSDIIGRYGGEEFTILLPDTDLHGARVFSERLRNVVKETMTCYEGTDIFVTVSVGISAISFHEGMSEIDSEEVLAALLKDADQALYKAKREGRNRVCMANPTQLCASGTNFNTVAEEQWAWIES